MKNETEPRPLKVKLLTAPQNALGTLFYVWEQSRTNNEVPTPGQIEELLNAKETYSYTYDDSQNPGEGSLSETCRMLGAEYEDELGYLVQPARKRVRDMITQILDEDIPCTENINFVFAIENMSISLREQMVRHRIGVTIGDRTGIDIVPEITKSSWWSQTMRMLPMGQFFTEGRYIMPDGLADKTVELNNFLLPFGEKNIEYLGQIPADELYISLMAQIEFVYNKLIEAGVAMEDARQIIPIGATHSITWSLNLKAMMHIVGKRACWVAQANLWEQLIAGMVDELCDKVDPVFRKFILPPCFKKGKYNSCPYFQINKERVQGRDHMPPCPLYVYHETERAIEAFESSVEDTGEEATWSPPYPKIVQGHPTVAESVQRDVRKWSSTQEIEERMLKENTERFERLWKLNVMTGEPLVENQMLTAEEYR